MTITPSVTLNPFGWEQLGATDDFTQLVIADAYGEATEAMKATLESQRHKWLSTLNRLLDDTDETLETLRRLPGEERSQVVADFENENARLSAAVRRHFGTGDDGEEASGGLAPGVTELQLSWVAGSLVAWAGGHRAPTETVEEVRRRLANLSAPADPWRPHEPISIPGGQHAETLVAPLSDVLGWLVAVGADVEGASLSASVKWLKQVAAIAVEGVAQGKMVPLLTKIRRVPGSSEHSLYSVRWAPAMIDAERLGALASTLPGVVRAFDPAADPRTLAQNAIADVVNAICRTAATRGDRSASGAVAETRSDVGAMFLAHLDGSEFTANSRSAGESVRRIEQWAKPVTSASKLRLVVQLDPPDEGDAWHLAVKAPDPDDVLEPVEVAMVTSSNSRRKEVQDHLNRLEKLYPVLLRPGAHRRGEVILSQDEAWTLMTETGEVLTAAGFDVRVPAMSPKKRKATLRLSAEAAGDTAVGAQQLAAVRWSAVFGDVELTAAEIARLATEARPLVRDQGKWVALDHADLAEAAAALAERASTTQLTGAEMLRHALGLEGSPVSGGINLVGDGWAAQLFAAASKIGDSLETEPDGFHGTLRSYQAESMAWLRFLDGAGLGGCLALDMGLGKTPTMLAHLRLCKASGTGAALVIAPPAVVGNWAAEAKKFTPDLNVAVHHGANRADVSKLESLAALNDVVITTYGTAVRDIDGLEKVRWARVVLDEAQIIKNPTSDTAQQLRRLDARSRVALTGTPIENGLGDLWAIMDFVNPGLVGDRAGFISHLSAKKVDASPDDGGDDDEHDSSAGDSPESALRALNGILVFRRTKSEPQIAAELPDRIDELDHCSMTAEQIGLYQAVLDSLVTGASQEGGRAPKGQVLAAITALKQICNHPSAYRHDDEPLDGRSGKLTRLEEIVEQVYESGERLLIFTHFAKWGEKLATHLSQKTASRVQCYHGGLPRGARDRMIADFQKETGPGALVLSLKAGGTGLNLTAASHVVLYDRWWNPAVEDQARDRVWRIGQTKTVICHRLVCPGTVDERVEEVVANKRQIAELVLPRSSSIGDLDSEQLRMALGLREDELLTDDDMEIEGVSYGA